MEEKKLDTKSIIGFVLIFGILLFMMWQNQPTEAELAEKAKQEQIEKAKKQATKKTATVASVGNTDAITMPLLSDSLQQIARQNKFGVFAFNNSKEKIISVENEVLSLKFNTIGAYLEEVKLKKYVDYSDAPIYLIKDNNSSFNLNFTTTNNRVFNTKDLPFNSKVTKSGNNTIISFKANVSATQFLEYKYIIKPNEYMIDVVMRSEGLDNIINSSNPVKLDWNLKAYSYDQSISYENRYTDIHYQSEGEEDYTGVRGADDEIEDLTWVSFKQHFFNSTLISDKAFKTAFIKSENLVENEDVDTTFTKQFSFKTDLALSGVNINNNFKLFYGPTDQNELEQYDANLDEIVGYGWGIFGWINKFLFIPLFAFLSQYFPYGIAIIVMTILIKLAMSFVQYKQYLSQMKLKILKPELEAIKEKHKNNKMKAQQETMALQSKAGASPLSGCLPALIQMPVFYALFSFFPVAFALRQKKFLWAEDLSSYDEVAKLPINVPFYGDHVSLFPILAAVAIFFYMKLTTGQQQISAPQQEGMPDMAKMMKYMIYFAPLMMLVFFNNYASGLSLYYFISNLISIGILLVIKHFILDEDKILAKIEVNKTKPKKENRFQKKMKEIMEEAEKQKQSQQKKNK